MQRAGLARAGNLGLLATIIVVVAFVTAGAAAGATGSGAAAVTIEPTFSQAAAFGIEAA
jgi:hypothetical protein